MRHRGDVVGPPYIFLHLNPDAKNVNYSPFREGTALILHTSKCNRSQIFRAEFVNNKDSFSLFRVGMFVIFNPNETRPGK